MQEVTKMIIDENNVGIRIDKYLTDNTEYTRNLKYKKWLIMEIY